MKLTLESIHNDPLMVESMKIFLLASALIVVIISLYFAYLGYQSRSQIPPSLGIVNNSLLPCPDSPNCVSSEAGTKAKQFVSPHNVTESHNGLILGKVNTAVLTLGGKIQSKTDHYLYATFKSKLFGFVDDFEVRYDQTQAVLHFRGASRVGKSDFDVNKKRVQAVTDLLN